MQDHANPAGQNPLDDAAFRALGDTNNWICLACDYNLTGITEPRCPDCGEFVDVYVQRAIIAGEPIPATEFDTQSTRFAYVRVLVQVAFSPGTFARRFPPVADVGCARTFTAVTYALAFLIYFLLMMFGTLGDNFPHSAMCPILGIGLATLSSGLICESAMAVMLWQIAIPHRAPRQYIFWRSLLHYTGGFMLGTAVWGAFLFILAATNNGLPFPLHVAMTTAAVALFLWWAFVVARMVDARARPGIRRILAMLFVPVVGLFSIMAGTIIAFLLLMLTA
ncbi:MAG: hypothetical protein AB7N71_13400 [Phycisphaerae bacterium]